MRRSTTDARVGGTAEFVPLAKERVNTIDAALATIDDGVGYDERTLEGQGRLGGTLLDPSQIVENAPVEKIGRTTGHTIGWFSAFNVGPVIHFPMRTRSQPSWRPYRWT